MKKGEKVAGNVVLKNLTAPLKIGPFELKNRMILAPINETTSGHNGEATEQCIAYYGARAKGGAAMVTTGAVVEQNGFRIRVGSQPLLFSSRTSARVVPFSLIASTILGPWPQLR